MIIVNLDVMLAKRKMSLTELSERVGITMANLSILKNGGEETPLRYFYEYEKPLAGQAHIIHTYMGDGNPVPSFCGEPVLIDTTSYHCVNCVMNDLWAGLNADNKVSAFVRLIDLETGEITDRIENKNA